MIKCGNCKMQDWCWVKETNKDCPTAREILDYFRIIKTQ
jgi:hypothetical protein